VIRTIIVITIVVVVVLITAWRKFVTVLNTIVREILGE
jgi:hypothetical protein